MQQTIFIMEDMPDGTELFVCFYTGDKYKKENVKSANTLRKATKQGIKILKVLISDIPDEED